MSGGRFSQAGSRDHRTAVFLHPAAFGYDFGPQHPMQPVRLRAMAALMEACHLFGPTGELREGTPATHDELLLAHSRAYIEAVRALSKPGAPAGNARSRLLESFGLGPGDTPAFEGMHEASAAIAGSTVAAVRAVIGGELRHAFSPAGGLHHAMRDRASGFCVYNDLVAGIAEARRVAGGRVLYLDFDAHHGDGVQAAFYNDPNVLSVSLHEDGRYLFPGSGDTDEIGSGAGAGYAINVPVAPFTDDAAWLAVVRELLPILCQRYRPALIVSQHGVDGHVWDPLTHLALTVAAFAEQTRLVHHLAHQYCDGRWVAAGGGGYEPIRTVPRVWTALWAEMSGAELPNTLPEGWLRQWGPYAEGDMPLQFDDPPEARPEILRRGEFEAQTRRAAMTAIDRARRIREPQRQPARSLGRSAGETVGKRDEPWTR